MNNLHDYIIEKYKLNYKKQDSFGLINKECFVYMENNINVFSIFIDNNLLYIDILNTKLKDINIKEESIVDKRVVNIKTWLLIKGQDNIINIIDFKMSYIKDTLKNNTLSKTKSNINLTGEDIDMINEREYNEKINNMRNICDIHEDGA